MIVPQVEKSCKIIPFESFKSRRKRRCFEDVKMKRTIVRKMTGKMVRLTERNIKLNERNIKLMAGLAGLFPLVIYNFQN